MEGQNSFMKTILQLKSLEKTKIGSWMISFQEIIFSSDLFLNLKVFLCAYRGSIENSSLVEQKDKKE